MGARLYLAGHFGNAAPGWETPGAFRAYLDRDAAPDEVYHLRNRLQAGGLGWYGLPGAVLLQRWQAQHTWRGWYAAQQVPPAIEHTLVLQGEVQETPQGLSLYYSRVPLPMRPALQQAAEQVWGLRARVLLQAALPWRDYDWLCELLARYPAHVIEFSTFSRCWGTVPGYQTLFWECRAY